MRVATLPITAKIRTMFSGEIRVDELTLGDSVLAYYYNERRMSSTAITGIEKIGSLPIFDIMIPQFRMIHLAKQSEVLTKHGETMMLEKPQHLLGCCAVNPKQIVAKQISSIMEAPKTELIEICWDGPDYLWAEGILVGTEYISND